MGAKKVSKKSGSWLKKIWVIIKNWNWQKIGGFGGLLGGVGTIVAIIFLSLNLYEIRMQKELEYKGYLSIEITDMKRISEDRFEFQIKLSPVGRSPVFLKGAKLIMLSQDREIDAALWSNLVSKKLEKMSETETFNPIMQATYITKDVGCGYVLDRLDSIWNTIPRQKLVGDTQEFFLHLMFKYEDMTGHNYWVYTRWGILRICSGVEGDKIYFGYRQPLLDNYIFWKANKSEMVPCFLPRELKEISRIAQVKAAKKDSIILSEDEIEGLFQRDVLKIKKPK